MPIIPTDFLEVAFDLKDHQKESHRRTSIGRSYYAVFLFFREYLNSNGVIKPGNPKQQVHIFIRACLKKSTVQSGRTAGTQLHLLHTEREKADYQPNCFITSQTSSYIYAKAKQTIEDFRNAISKNPLDEKALIQNAIQFAASWKY